LALERSVRRKGFVVRRLSFSILLLTALLLALSYTAPAQDGSGSQAGTFPQQIGEFRAQKLPKTLPLDVSPVTLEDFQVVSNDEREYAAPDGRKYVVGLTQTKSTSAAYSLLRYFGGEGKPVPYSFGVNGDFGVYGLAGPRVKFIKGTTVVSVTGMSTQTDDQQATLSFAKEVAAAIQGMPGSVPPLVLHLPDWEKKHPSLGASGVGYAVSLPVLRSLVGDSGQKAFDALPFDEGVEAATASYDGARLVVVEFPTPQHAFDADAAVNQRIAQLRAEGRPVPSSYKRVGNYSVFVFDAPDAASAEKLVSGVKYEKDVRWLGRNPHENENAIRSYTNTMGGVIMTTLITTGLAILGCLTVGGVIGGAIFLSRRARHAAQEIYSDAGGMLRLNIEDVNTPQTTKMLGRGED
jgi:hypothetical protein